MSKLVEDFFSSLEKNSNSINLDGLSSQYADTFVFADSSGIKVVPKDAFLKMLPQRKAYVESLGLKYTKTVALVEKELDDHYIQVEAKVVMHFEKDIQNPIEETDSSTYILFREKDSLKIVFHLEHRNLMEKVQKLGLSPS